MSFTNDAIIHIRNNIIILSLKTEPIIEISMQIMKQNYVIPLTRINARTILKI